ncbi:MAG: chromosome partitioning protein [Bacteroidetes bacterium]|nr:MAG: chromosome partitioning protein [Bacteroidota bacterium]PTM11209.1 MAG: chromosome partitioning protein [Bacteroidota bacterium]
MEIDKNTLIKALAGVKDPHTGQDLITANRVRDLEVDGANVRFTLELPNLNNDYKSQLNFACQEAILAHYPQANVHVHMMSHTAESQESTSPLPHVQNIIAVGSGKGGVGKSTVAVNLALGLRALGARVGLLDADLYGPSIPTMLGLAGQRPKIETIHGQPKIMPLEAHGIYTMSIGFIIEAEQAVVLRGPRLSGIIRQFINDTVWPPLDYLIVDLPPGTGDIQLTLVQTVPLTGAILVTTPQQVALDDAIKAMNMLFLPNINIPVLGVVENMAWFTPAELPNNKYYIFGQGAGAKLAKASNSMLLGQVPLVQGIRESGDAGVPAMLNKADTISRPVFLKIAQNTVRQLALRNEMMGPSQVVKVQS